MDTSEIAALFPVIIQGLQILLTHHATQDPVPTPASKQAATSVLDKLKHVVHPIDPETGQGPLATS